MLHESINRFCNFTKPVPLNISQTRYVGWDNSLNWAELGFVLLNIEASKSAILSLTTMLVTVTLNAPDWHILLHTVSLILFIAACVNLCCCEKETRNDHKRLIAVPLIFPMNDKDLSFFGKSEYIKYILNGSSATYFHLLYQFHLHSNIIIRESLYQTDDGNDKVVTIRRTFPKENCIDLISLSQNTSLCTLYHNVSGQCVLVGAAQFCAM